MPAVLGGCGDGGALDPAGPAAGRIADLWWWLLAVGVAVQVLVVVPVVLLVVRSLRRQRSQAPDGGDAGDGDGGGHGLIVLGGIVLPALVLPGLFVLNLDALGAASDTGNEPLVVEVTGRQWWWEVRYPDLDVVTANEIHLPVGTDVELLLSSADVNHSFWVPPLNGKMDLIPGRSTTLPLRADEAGTYHGVCAEYCGIQHANMRITVVAESAARFERWADRNAAPADPAPEVAEDGRRAFLGNGCGSCHTVRGIGADGDVGPDLTHFGSRETIGAGTVPNTRGHLGGWIANSQTIKPGNLMPPISLTPDELRLLITYLESLE